jgi:hypothetical protein
MKKLIRSALMAAVSCAVSIPAAAGEVRLSIANGRVTLFAQDATVREILSEWARVGQTRIVNAEKVTGVPLTLELRDVPEAQALDTILRSASGHVLVPRSAGTTGPSVYDRIMILATSRPPANSPVTPAPFTRTMQQPQPQPQQAEDDGNDQPQQPPPGVVPGTQMFPGPAGQAGLPNQTPMTSPRPGMVPQPQQPTNVNPYQIQNQGPNQPFVPPNQPGGVAPNQPAPTYPNVPGMTYPNVPGAASPVPGTQPPRRPGGGAQ